MRAAHGRGVHVARKRFGQHFLVDRTLIDRIVREIAPRSGQALVEIGPGLGALTQPVLERAGALTVIELDRDLASRWRSRPGVTVVESDVLVVDFVQLAAAAAAPKLRVFGNLPYNISTPILFHLLPAAGVIQDQHLMLQKEVVERMAAEPASKAYGRLSVMLQWRYVIEKVLDVPPPAFEPPPRVDSAVVRMTPCAASSVGHVDVERLGAVVMAAFSQRRKLLRHSLGPWLDAAGYGGRFDLHRRAEEVTVPEFVALACELPQTHEATARPPRLD